MSKTDMLIYGSLFLVMIFGGGFILFSVIIYPYFNEVSIPQTQDEVLIENTGGVPKESTFSEEVRLNLIYILVIPFLILFAVLSIVFILREDYNQGMKFTIISFFFTMVLIVFDRITVLANSKKILIKLGPFKDEIEMENVKSIIAINIRPIRDYMGVGKRLGPDGSIGYIAYKKTGVRIKRIKGKDLVVTLTNSEELANFVRYYKS